MKSSKIDLTSLERVQLEQFARKLGQPAYRGRQIFSWLWRPGIRSFDQMTNLPKLLREQLSEIVAIPHPKPLEVQRSRDGTVKYAWLLPDGLSIESVLIPERDHNTICLSTQVGCQMGCRFCHTARMGFIRNLTPGEIAGQVLCIVEEIGDRALVRNLVFMGMGEPLANYDALICALSILTDELGLNFSSRRITVSTCGLVPEMLRLGKDADVGLAISLHAPTDKIRSRIMPINRRYPLRQLLSACRQYPLARRRRITFEYLLLSGINDRASHARELAEILRGIPAKVNLIPFNESPGIPFRRSDEENMLQFQQILLDEGYTAIIRKSKGQDISAACGQLCRKDLRRDVKSQSELEARFISMMDSDPG